ncbi:natural killer cell receptor 2B4-like isoform X2 [Tyto alba]|uniref:natural killer cell receptor 2B4-like isoform X2 n=1 Tax=Tyto alba TaxID=56313 RepID=UPI001C671402|nr:natural killer cell receptor 2B4-like isoform X2 [Tyto alba]
MRRDGGPRCPAVLLCLVLLAATGGRGSPNCREQAVSAGGTLQLLLGKPPKGWVRVEWRAKLDLGYQHRILTAEHNQSVEFSMSPFSGRTEFQQENFSLRISPVSTADSGEYRADFEDSSGAVTDQCFHVSVWEPVHRPHLDARILHREQDRCNLSLVCTVPGAGDVSYSWSCGGDPPGTPQPQSRLQLQVRGDTDPTVCRCNVSNPVSWDTASTDIVAACRAAASGLFSMIPQWAVALALGLALATSIALAVSCYWWKKRRKDPSGHVEQPLTVYEEVGKTRTNRDPNGTSEATVGGNTIYAVVCNKAQGPRCSQEPESCTIYSTVQPSRRSPSLRRKRLDRALVSTAYVEATGGSRHWCPPLQTSPLASASHHLS